MFKYILLVAFCSMLCLSIYAQNHPVKITAFTGDEKITEGNYVEINPENIFIPNQKIQTPSFTFEMHNIAGYYTGYDLQSNASPQQLWYDITTGSLNAVFMTSQQDAGWTDRTSTYFYSTDTGITWSIVGHVPPPESAVSGFPAIIGLSSGKIVIANHTNLGGSPTRTQLFINSAPGEYDFMNYDPGTTSDAPIWPKLGVSNNDLIFFASASISDPILFLNSFDPIAEIFSGYSTSVGSEPEGYSFSTSNEGKIGFAFLDGEGGAWFIETTDEGITWSPQIKIFEPFLEIENGDTLLHGTIRGINTAYIGESPKVVFEIYRRTPDLQDWYPALPSEIYFWSPEIHSGDAVIIADSNNVPFYPNQGYVGTYAPIARPVIGKSYGDEDLYVAFYAASEAVSISPDSTRFYAGYFMMSEDGGQTWSIPGRFTPVTNPPLDWRWVSIAPINPNYVPNTKTIHLVMVGDPIAGALAPVQFPSVTAQFYHFYASIPNTINDSEIINEFYLSQNYPNPFNPATRIRYQIPETGLVTLKVYDILGREVTTLVNEEKPVGSYEIQFDASQFASGVYLYRIQAGSFISTKKMILIK